MTDWKSRIEPLFYRLVATRSDTNTLYEAVIEEQILSWIKDLKYFQKNPENVGTIPIANDPLERQVIWALMKGRGKKTIVLIHHHDAVDIEDYGSLKKSALRPADLKKALSCRDVKKSVKKDIDSGDWIFGRGTADMKAGAAIQLSLLAAISEEKGFEGNILLLSVPDEESFSKGMLAAVELMCELQSIFNLEFVLSINSEPYFNNVKNKAIMYEGSVGKIMPIVYVKGVKSHIGDPFNGINPSIILANIQAMTELNVELCDQVASEATPPPVWINFRANKKSYDASIPESATGYFNWLTFTKTPNQVIEILKEISALALDRTLFNFKYSYQSFCQMNKTEVDEIDFEPKVLDFATLFEMALDKGADEFKKSYKRFENKVNGLLVDNEITQPEASIKLLEFTADYIDLDGPVVVVAISGPYYPHVSNYLLRSRRKFKLEKIVNEISINLFGVEYESQAYFMGISDLSYVSWTGNLKTINTIKSNSPGWNKIYSIPFWAIRKLKSPVVNIGPWGKDLHKPTERVFEKDVFERVPEIIYQLIKKVLIEVR